MKVATDLRVLVSNHYKSTGFAIRGKYDTSYKSGQFVETDGPGTGFFVRNSSSRAYHEFVQGVVKANKPTYLKMVLGKEFSFDDELAAAEEALSHAEDKMKNLILESYVNTLPYAKEAELGERIIRGIKDRSHRHHHHLNSYQTGVLTSYKSRVAKLGHDVRKIQLHISQICPEEKYNRFSEVAKAFANAASSHRIWHVLDEGLREGSRHELVYFDLGIFDFFQTPMMTPLMRTTTGETYYLYPDFVIRARKSTDFDVIPLKDLTFIYREQPYDMVSGMITHHSSKKKKSKRRSKGTHPDYDTFGSGLLVPEHEVALEDFDKEEEKHVKVRVVGELHIPEINLHYYSQDNATMHTFVNVMRDYKNTLE